MYKREVNSKITFFQFNKMKWLYVFIVATALLGVVIGKMCAFDVKYTEVYFQINLAFQCPTYPSGVDCFRNPCEVILFTHGKWFAKTNF